MKDSEIIELIRRKDERGAEALLRDYGPLMRYIIAPILKDPYDREEALSDAAMRVWEHIDLFDPDKGSWTGWLTVLTRNVAVSLQRKKATDLQTETLNEEVYGGIPDGSLRHPGESMPETEAIKSEQVAALKAALSGLNKLERQLFYRKYYYRQTAAQIGTELGFTTKAVERRLERIREKLRAELGEVYYGR